MKPEPRTTYYLPGEGRAHMKECLTLAFQRCSEVGLKKIVVFTGTGEGALFALQELLPQPQFADIELVAVSPPVGRPYRLDPTDPTSQVVPAGLAPDLRDFLVEAGITVVSAHLPFKPIGGPDSPTSATNVMGEVLAIMGGGVPLCVQAALVACDAGAVGVGERIIVASGDTAVQIVATRTETFLSKTHGLVVEDFVCRPAALNISKATNRLLRPRKTSASDTKQLPEPAAKELAEKKDD